MPRRIPDVPVDPLMIDERAVGTMTSLSHATIWRMVKGGGFPQPVRFGKRCARWRKSDIEAWVAGL